MGLICQFLHCYAFCFLTFTLIGLILRPPWGLPCSGLCLVWLLLVSPRIFVLIRFLFISWWEAGIIFISPFFKYFSFLKEKIYQKNNATFRQSILSEGTHKKHLNSENFPWRKVCIPNRLQNLGHFCRRAIRCHLRNRACLTILQQGQPCQMLIKNVLNFLSADDLLSFWDFCEFISNLNKLDSLVAFLIDVEHLQKYGFMIMSSITIILHCWQQMMTIIMSRMLVIVMMMVVMVMMVVLLLMMMMMMAVSTIAEWALVALWIGVSDDDHDETCTKWW